MATGSTVITGGLVLASGASHAAPADLLLHDDLIVAITPPGEVTSEAPVAGSSAIATAVGR